MVDESQQTGTNFGEKFCNALEHCFEKGYNKIISIGTDCPTLSKEILNYAETASHNNNLLGADTNGGFYLFALHKKHYDRTCFKSFSWCSKNLLKDIFTYFKSNNLTQPANIKKANDVNSSVDLIKIFKSKKVILFIQLLLDLFNKTTSQLEIIVCHIRFLRTNVFLLRGPPTIVNISF